MTKLPEIVKTSWENRDGALIFTTVDEKGMPNAIQATCVSIYNDEMVVIANNYFDKTIKNIEAGSKGSVLFMAKDGKTIQIKGCVKYFEDGPVFDDMKTWNPEKHPGHGAAAVIIEEVYSGAEKIM